MDSELSPVGYPESPTDDDEIFLCKGCGEILEQGRAFELAGHRWHLTCFRCHSCGTLLDSDANLLLLGDGSLICNNCTYSCSSCGNKIEDLAILTGDQAFCATCFKCRNCKRKIENLRYARTSQGIFCMSCHESLMARRRKKGKQSRQASASTNSNKPVVLDKSLPALPPSAVPQSALQGGLERRTSASYNDIPPEREREREREREPRSSYLSTIRDDSSRRDISPISDDGRQGQETLTLPASTYKEERASTISSMTSDNDDDRAGFLPMAFDPNPAPGPPPLSNRAARQQDDSENASNQRAKENLSPRDYLGKTPRPERLSTGRPASARSVASSERSDTNATKTASPHLAYQDKTASPRAVFQEKAGSPRVAYQDRALSPAASHQDRARAPRRRDVSERSASASPHVVSPLLPSDDIDTPRLPRLNSASYAPGAPEPFKLQEVPKDRKVSRSSTYSAAQSPSAPGLETLNQSRYQPPSEPNVSPSSPTSLDTLSSSFNPFDDPKLHDPTSAPPSTRIPARGDSLPRSTRKSVDPSGFEPREQPQSLHSPPRSGGSDPPVAPPRAASRPSGSSRSAGNNNGDFVAPRPPPPPPPAERPSTESVGTFQSDADRSAFAATSPQNWRGHLPKHSIGGDLSMEEEMARILRGEDKRKESSSEGASVLRRVSNAVKHGRSFSDRSAHGHHKTPTMGSLEISSPMTIGSPMSSAGLREDLASVKAQLRRCQQRIAELEADKVGLEEQVTTSADIKQANTELREKRSTMAFLDTQREMVVRELEVMTEHLSKAKESNQPLDIQALKSDVLQDFARSLQKLKDSISVQVEDLVHKRNELTDDIGSLIQVKDKGLQEFESLSQKNQQLAEMNHQLLTNIQDLYKANAGRVPNPAILDRSPMTNGLGIYAGSSRQDLAADFSSLKGSSLQESSSLHNLIPEAAEAEPATILTAPKVVDIRKGQPKKFWKKGSGGIGKSVTKGIKGAFAGGSDRMPMNGKEGQFDLNGMPYSQMQAGPGAADSPLNLKQDGKGGFGFFSSGQRTGLKPGSVSNGKNNSATNLAVESASVLFGSDLRERCEFEKKVVPLIVTRCIDEVELRGMDMEGIYRKSGGSGQVKSIQQGFDKDGNYDISDPDLDIHAVTSALKQYFRKLPNPLITYEAYDGVLHAAQITDKEKQIATMKAALDALPQAHQDVLEYLVQHLCRVVRMESENLMTPLNLSVVFAPTIMRPLSIEREMSDMQAQRMAVQALLEHADAIFEPLE